MSKSFASSEDLTEKRASIEELTTLVATRPRTPEASRWSASSTPSSSPL